MSEHDTHGEPLGADGFEPDIQDVRGIAVVMTILAAFVVFSIIFLWGLFNILVSNEKDEKNAGVDPQLEVPRLAQAEELGSFGLVGCPDGQGGLTLEDCTGGPQAVFRMPIGDAKKQMKANPALLKAGVWPEGLESKKSASAAPAPTAPAPTKAVTGQPMPPTPAPTQPVEGATAAPGEGAAAGAAAGTAGPGPTPGPGAEGGAVQPEGGPAPSPEGGAAAPQPEGGTAPQPEGGAAPSPEGGAAAPQPEGGAEEAKPEEAKPEEAKPEGGAEAKPEEAKPEEAPANP